MTKKMYLGIAALIVFMIAAGGFIYWNVSTVQQMKKQTALFEELLEKEQKPVTAKEPPPAAPGKKWVPHGDHFHEVPIDAPDVWQGEPHEPAAQDAARDGAAYQPYVPYTGPLTYHEELLKTNPVEALRLQAEERGHPAAKWIPPFPPEDLEAQEFARNIYLSIYLDEKDPARQKASMAMLGQLDAINAKYPYGARLMDLSRLTWIGTTVPNDFYSPERIPYPSDYFKLYSSDLK